MVKKNSLFSAAELNSAVESATQFEMHTFKMLLAVFTLASIVIAAFSPMVCLFDQTVSILKDLFGFAAVFCFMVLMIGYKNTKKLHLILTLIFAFSFGALSCLLVGKTILAFTVPTAVLSAVIILTGKLRHGIYTTKDGALILCFLAPITFVCVYLTASLFMACVSTLHLLMFFSVIAFSFKTAIAKQPMYGWGTISKLTPTFLIITHLLLANIVLISGFIIVG